MLLCIINNMPSVLSMVFFSNGIKYNIIYYIMLAPPCLPYLPYLSCCVKNWL